MTAASLRTLLLTFRIPFCVLLLFLQACSGSKEDPASIVRRFFEQCQSGEISTAYKEATIGFQMEKSERYFAARVKDIGLEKLTTLDIKNPEMNGREAVVPVEITPEGNEKFTFNATLFLERGKWRIHEIMLIPKDPKMNPEDIFTVRPRTEDTKQMVRRAFIEPVALALPGNAELQRLAKEAILLFDEAIRENDFKAFFDYTSLRWKTRGLDEEAQDKDWKNRSNRLTILALKESFKRFVDEKADFSRVRDATMTLEEPARITANGVLNLNGAFDAEIYLGVSDAKSNHMKFKLEFVFEGAQWKLFGIAIQLEPTGSGESLK